MTHGSTAAGFFDGATFTPDAASAVSPGTPPPLHPVRHRDARRHLEWRIIVDLAALGFTKEEIEDKVIESICATVLADTHLDEDGNPTSHRSPFYRRMTEEINKRMNERIAALGAQHIEPNITGLIEATVLQRTNEWGEKKGEPKTFIQYLTERAEAYVVEPVSHDGKTKAQDSYNWRPSTTRIAYMIDAHLQYSIKTAMEKALADANTTITKGIADAVKLALAEVQQKLKVSVVTK